MVFCKREHDGHVVVTVGRELLDLSLAKDFRAALATQGWVGALLLDMSRVEYVDSIIISVLVERFLSFRRERRRFILFGLQQTVLDLLRTTNLLDVFDVCVDAEAAGRLAAKPISPEEAAVPPSGEEEPDSPPSGP